MLQYLFYHHNASCSDSNPLYIFLWLRVTLQVVLNSPVVYVRRLKKGPHFISPYKTGTVRQTLLLFHALLISPWQHTSPCRRLPNWQCKTEHTHPPIHPASSLSLEPRRHCLYSKLAYASKPYRSFNRLQKLICRLWEAPTTLFLLQGLICWNSREANCNRCYWPKALQVAIESGVGAGSQCRRI